MKSRIAHLFLAIGLSQVSGAIRAYTVTLMWLWFLVPSLHVAVLPFWAAWGIGEVFDLYHTYHASSHDIFGKVDVDHDNAAYVGMSKDKLNVHKHLLFIFFLYPVSIVFGWVVKHIFM